MDQRSAKPLFVLALCVSGLSLALGAKWSYEGAAGPLYWHELFPHACSGRQQSPIDIKPEETMYSPKLKDFALWYDPPKPDSKMYIRNNGHTVQVDLEGDFFVSNGGLSNMYKAVQFHFHWGHKVHVGSEHLFDGRPSPIELHLVTFNQDLYADIGAAVTERGGLAVLGVMFEPSNEDNPALEPIVKAIKHIRDPEDRTRISLPLISLRDLMPEDMTRYYRYNGSLTTPGCFESVTWTVFERKQHISHRQLKEFRSLLQFRHKHRGSRHRRSLGRAQRRMERQAEEVLSELGILDDKFEKDLLKAELTKEKLGDMFGDMPHSGGHSNTAGHGSDSHGSKSHGGHHHSTAPMESKYKTVLPTEQAVIEEVEEEFHYTQDILVNNYRPVQPLYNRVVYRSFKLREPQVQHEDEGHHGGAVHEDSHTGAAHDRSHGHGHGRGDNGAAAFGGQGILAGVCCFFIALILSW